MKIIETNTLVIEFTLPEIIGLIHDIDQLEPEYVRDNHLVKFYNMLRGETDK